MPTDPSQAGSPRSPAIPLSRWASRQLADLAEITGSAAIAQLDGPTLLGERASNGGYLVPGLRSAGLGSSGLMPTRDGGWFALTLLRDDDRALVPAMLGIDQSGQISDEYLAAEVLHWDCRELLARARDLGLPAATADETPISPPLDRTATGLHREPPNDRAPLVVDLSAIWAGPLAGHLLWLAGAKVVKVESPSRPDLIRRDDPATFDLINQGKASVLAELTDIAQRDAVIALIRRADIVIESSRLRALAHLGLDANQIVRETPGLVWLSVTGHGARGDAAHWAGVGNDCSVAAGLSRAMVDVGGDMGYVGDALTDPLTGIVAAKLGWQAWLDGTACRTVLSMSAIGAMALAEERVFDLAAIDRELLTWSESRGRPFPAVPRRTMSEPVRPLGSDTEQWLAC
ncbi:CoA transferase [Novosphingobium aquae]|uniref:CoA transferase n=1 Tax=Novosphingobium aquae TaxID=3133435 RepID=A0ABU8S823_9SPHN